MKKIVFTQRVDVIESYRERRDCADQNISKLLSACGFLPVPIMNNPALVKVFCDEVKLDGIFFSGGNDLSAYGGNAPERDETENALIEYAIQEGIPLFGICRGMQMIAVYFGSHLQKVENHIRVSHTVEGAISREAVNSFHGMGIKNVASPLVELAKSDDGVVEAIQHKDYRIAAIMWHPERVGDFLQEDISLITKFFNGGTFV